MAQSAGGGGGGGTRKASIGQVTREVPASPPEGTRRQIPPEEKARLQDRAKNQK